MHRIIPNKNRIAGLQWRLSREDAHGASVRFERDGATIRAGKLFREDTPASRSDDVQMAAAAPAASKAGAAPPLPAQGAVATTFSAGPSGATGGVVLSVNISMDYSQMGTWPPQVVSAFMAGLAQVINAKAAAEQNAMR